MLTHQKKVEIFALHREIIGESDGLGWFIVSGGEDDRKIDIAIESFAPEVSKNKVVGFVNTALLSSKTGFLFTDDELYYYEKPFFSSGNLQIISYKNIRMLTIEPFDQKDYSETLTIYGSGGTKIEATMTPFIIHFVYLVLTDIAKESSSQFMAREYNGQHQIVEEKIKNETWEKAKEMMISGYKRIENYETKNKNAKQKSDKSKSAESKQEI